MTTAGASDPSDAPGARIALLTRHGTRARTRPRARAGWQAASRRRFRHRHARQLHPRDPAGRPQLEAAFHRARAESAGGQVFLESDLRAHANPTRMAMIRQAAEDLATRYRSPCPRCGAPTREMRARSDLMHADPARCDLYNP